MEKARELHSEADAEEHRSEHGAIMKLDKALPRMHIGVSKAEGEIKHPCPNSHLREGLKK